MATDSIYSVSAKKAVRNTGKLIDLFEGGRCDECGSISSRRNRKELVLIGPEKGNFFSLSGCSIHVVSDPVRKILQPSSPAGACFRPVSVVYGTQKVPLWEIYPGQARLVPVGNVRRDKNDARAWFCTTCKAGSIYYDGPNPFEIYISDDQVCSMTGEWIETMVGPLLVKEGVVKRLREVIAGRDVDVNEVKVIPKEDVVPLSKLSVQR